MECLKLSSTNTNAKSFRQTIKKLMIFEDLCQEEQKALVTTEMTFSFSRYIAKIPLQKGRSDKQNYSKHTSRLLWDKILVLIVD